MNTRITVKYLTTFFALCLTCVVSLASAAPAGSSTLRNNALDVEAPAEPLKKTMDQDGVMNREFVQQPPLIPHNVRGYQIDKNVNKCLMCHSWKNAKKWGATRISVTHFYDRDGKQLADVAPGRYFCLQCHVPQANAKPLIENDFKPVESLDSGHNK